MLGYFLAGLIFFMLGVLFRCASSYGWEQKAGIGIFALAGIFFALMIMEIIKSRKKRKVIL